MNLNDLKLNGTNSISIIDSLKAPLLKLNVKLNINTLASIGTNEVYNKAKSDILDAIQEDLFSQRKCRVIIQETKNYELGNYESNGYYPPNISVINNSN